MSVLLPIAFTVVLTVAAQVVLKLAASSLGGGAAPAAGSPGLRILRIPGVVAGLALYAASAAVWLYVLSGSALSYAYPFLGLTYVGVAVASQTVLRERFYPRQWMGLALVMIGVLAVAASR